MSSVNKVILVGRLGQEPEKKVIANGNSVVTLSLATSENWKDQQGNKQQKTEWHRIVLWNQLADLVEKFCHKGSNLYIEGSLETREWNDKDGNKRYTTEIKGKQVVFLDPKESVHGGNHNGYSENHPGAHGGQAQDDFIESDIPF